MTTLDIADWMANNALRIYDLAFLIQLVLFVVNWAGFGSRIAKYGRSFIGGIIGFLFEFAAFYILIEYFSPYVVVLLALITFAWVVRNKWTGAIITVLAFVLQNWIHISVVINR